jgi:hypothetical protein
MSDTVAVAVIAVAGTLGSGALSGGLSYLASRSATRVQLAGVNADLEKLWTTRTDELRKERKEAFHEYLDALDDLESVFYGTTPTKATEQSTLEAAKGFRRIATKTSLVAAPELSEDINSLVTVLTSIFSVSQKLEAEEGWPLTKALKAAMKEKGEEWRRVRRQVVASMKKELEPLG